MEYSIQINAVKNEQSKTKAFVTVVFGNSFLISDISIMEGKNETVFVSMPSYPGHERTEHNEPVYKEYCFPITKEFREKLYKDILDLYEEMKQKETKIIQKSIPEDEKIKPEDYTIEVTLMENEGESNALLAWVNLKFEENFVVKNIRIVNGEDGEFVTMPSRKNGNGKYKDVTYPITKEFRKELFTSILDSYHQKITEEAPFTENE